MSRVGDQGATPAAAPNAEGRSHEGSQPRPPSDRQRGSERGQPAASSPRGQAVRRRLRVVTWNIHKGVGGADRLHDLERTVRALKHYDADVVLLQEVAQDMPRLKREDQVQALSDAFEMHVAFAKEHAFRQGHYGNLILSRFAMEHSQRCDLTIGRRKKRGCLQAHLRVPLGTHTRSLLVHNVHLGLAGSERSAQLKRLMSWHELTRHHPQTPLLVGGDLNDVWATLGRMHLRPHGLRRAGPIRNSFPAALPLRPLDALFFRGSVELLHAHVGRTELARSASDHRPVIADLSLSLG